VNKIIGDDKQLLKLAFESITESLLKDPFRLQSFFEYAMSVAPTSTSSPTANNNGNYEMQPRFYGQCYNYLPIGVAIDDSRNIHLANSFSVTEICLICQEFT
jgi:hypothetical protein